MSLRLLTTCIFLMCVIPLAVNRASAGEGWIDVHFHIVGEVGEKEGYVEAARRTIEVMNDSGIDRIIAMPPPRPFTSFDIEDLAAMREKYGSRISFMGGGGTLNPMLQEAAHSGELTADMKKEFEARAEKIIASGAKGFGEITAHHVSLNPGHGYESVPADHPLLLLLADIAARHNVPIDLHFDPIPEDVETPANLSSPKNPATMKENISGFERLLAHNRKARIVWAHAGSDPVGFFTPRLVRKMLAKHPNLYCSIRTTYKFNKPMRHPKRGVNDNWIAVVKKFPDRFVMGTDSFVLTPGYSGPNGPRVFERNTWVQREGVNEVLSYVDADLARKIGRDNAIRIYNLGN